MEIKRRFSLPHWDGAGVQDHQFLRAFAASSVEYKSEIADIYFGAEFHYEYGGAARRYGNVMGVSASSDQVRDLLLIQDEFGVPCSLTLNQVTHPPEIIRDPAVLDAFLGFIRSHYESGVRMCTISNVHLMAMGILQSEFPAMHWKNTVNHRVRTAQEVVDFTHLGYRTIQVDRSLNRNIDELERMHAAARARDARLALLVAEACMPECPFKLEHDSIQPLLQGATANYWQQFGMLSCYRWRECGSEGLSDQPRLGTDCVWIRESTFRAFADVSDVFKFSGRLPSEDATRGMPEARLAWVSRIGQGRFQRQDVLSGRDGPIAYADSFQEVLEAGLVPLSMWSPNGVVGPRPERNWDGHRRRVEESVWGSARALALEQKLMRCRSQCYDCHLCERTFGVEEVDSLLELKKPNFTYGALHARRPGRGPGPKS